MKTNNEENTAFVSNMLSENGIQATTSSNKVCYTGHLLFYVTLILIQSNYSRHYNWCWDLTRCMWTELQHTQTLSMLTHNKWQKKRLERVRMKEEKAITGSVITCHYTILAICITRWVIKGSSTVTLQLIRRLILLRKAVWTVHKNKWPLPNISQIIISCVKKSVLWFLFHIPNQILLAVCIFDYPYIFSSSLSKTIRIILYTWNNFW